MRLTSIGVLLFSLWSQITTCKDEPCFCGYNHLLYSVRSFPASNYNVYWSFVMIQQRNLFLVVDARSVLGVLGGFIYASFYRQCWETRVGQEMYKLTIFDFIIIAAVTIFVEFPRK